MQRVTAQGQPDIEEKRGLTERTRERDNRKEQTEVQSVASEQGCILDPADLLGSSRVLFGGLSQRERVKSPS